MTSNKAEQLFKPETLDTNIEGHWIEVFRTQKKYKNLLDFNICLISHSSCQKHLEYHRHFIKENLKI